MSEIGLSIIPHNNGKSQPWRTQWPPQKPDLKAAVDSQGQILLLDGTGGSGSAAMPGPVMLPPKTQEQPKSQEQPESTKPGSNQEVPDK